MLTEKKTISALILTLLLTSTLTAAFDIQPARADYVWAETIYIRANGSIEPLVAPISSVDNVTYTLTDNIVNAAPSDHASAIFIERDSMVLDGAGYTLQGTNAIDSKGIELMGRSNVTIQNMKITAFACGILLSCSSGNTVKGNAFVDTGLYVHDSYGCSVVDNLVNGKPLVYIEDASDALVEDAGQVILVKCSNITVENLNLSNTCAGVQLWETNNTTIARNNITNNEFGVLLDSSSNDNTVSGNNITNNDDVGVWLWDSCNHNTVSGNNITANNNGGVDLWDSCNHNTVSGNNITANNNHGILLDFSSNHNVVSGNDITANKEEGVWLSVSFNCTVWGNSITANILGGIRLGGSSNNTFTINNITNNHYSFELFSSSNNRIYHNNLVNNTHQVYTEGSVNVWDDGYPSGGNYWSNYSGLDSNGDGIGDTPFIIDANSQDRYPLMDPFIAERARLFSGSPAIQWNRTYGGAENDESYSVVQTNDGGYVLTGYTFSFGSDWRPHIWLVKTDSSGNVQWNKTYEGKWEGAYCVVQTADGGYGLAGSKTSGGYDEDFLIVKTDTDGDMFWNKTYGGVDTDIAWSMVQTKDGGYALVGYTNSFGAGYLDIWLVKTDSAGNMQWNKTYGGANDDRAYSIVQTSDGGYAMVGYTDSFGVSGDFWLVKTDANGSMQWNRTYGGGSLDFGSSVVQTSDGGYAIAGWTQSFGAGNSDFWLVKTDASGSMQWEKAYGGYDDDAAFSVVQTSDGGYAMAGETSSFGIGQSDLWLVKTDASGNMQWNTSCGRSGFDWANAVVQTRDGGYALTGYTGDAVGDFWLVKIAPDHDVALVDATPSETVIGQGYSTFINVTVENQGCCTETFNVTVYANQIPLETQTIVIPSGSSTDVTFTWNTTGFDKGNYTIRAWAQPVLGEMDTADNTLTDGTVTVVGSTKADLSTVSTDISFSDFNPPEGQTITISATIRNIGESDTENVSVQFFDATTLIGEQRISFISHCSQGIASIDRKAEGEGFHLIKVEVDPYNVISETDETNNMATRSILVGKHTGYGGIIVVGNLSTHETLPGSFINVNGHAGYNTTYGAGEPVAGASVTITVLGDAGQWTTHTINTGDYSQQITTPYYAGNYTVVATVSDGTFSESINLPLAVLQPPEGVDLTLSPTDILFLPPDPLENDNATVTAAIHNIGSLNATNVTVGFFINGDLVANNTLDFILAQGTGTTSTWWIFTSGTNIITVKTYLNSPIPELNPNNNQASRNLYVYPASPDPTPINIYFSDNTPIANQNITLTAEVKNVGGLDVSNLTVAFYEDDNPIGERTIPYISGKGGTATSSLSHSFTNEGPHTIKVQVDPYQSIPEADENNNNYSKNIYVHLPSPDLTLSPSDITFSEYNPLNGTQITIYAAIHNIGEFDAESVVVQLLDGNTEISLDTVPLIRSGSYETLNNTWTAMPPGLHSIKVRIDPNNAINESDENNNAAVRSIYVYPAPEQPVPDLAIYETDIVFSNTNPHPGENVTIYATIHNIGEELAENVSVAFYVEDVQIGPVQTIMSLPAKGNETLSTSWISSEIGSHVAKAEIDPGYFIIESDKSNNVATRAIIVGKLHDAWETSFTGSDEHPIIDLAVLDGGLYAAADNRLYVYYGNSWSAIDAPTFVTSLEPYGDKLVVGGKGGLYCYDGASFNLIFSVPTYIKVLGAYNNTLYAGTFLDKPPILYYCNGNADNPDNWHIDTSFSAILNFSGPFGSVDSFAEYDGNLYVTSGGNIYSYNETGWNAVKTFDDVYGFSCMQAYNDKLYLATRDQGWRKPLYQGGTGFSGRVIEFDGENWTTVLDHDYWIYSLGVYDGKLYAGTANAISTYNGTTWETSFNATGGAYYALCFENYDGKIYAGMGNGYIFVDPAPAKANPETIVVPEFPSTTIPAVFMALTMLAAALTRKNRNKRFD